MDNMVMIIMWIMCGIVVTIGTIVTKDIECISLLLIPAFVSFWNMMFKNM